MEVKIGKQMKGITLIALVITIIVLLILAGVSIAMLTGPSGLLTQAQKAKEQTEKASEEEQRQLTIAEATMNLNGTKYKSTYKGKEVTVPIPAGFAVSQVDGENTVEDGLVVIDSEGNEFVWVPVPDINKFIRVEGYYQGSKLSILSGRSEPFENGYSTEKEEYEKMVSSVTQNGGFYIGRFEVGKDMNENVVVKKDVDVYTNIGWSNSDDMKNEEGGAVQKSKEFKKRKSI